MVALSVVKKALGAAFGSHASLRWIVFLVLQGGAGCVWATSAASTVTEAPLVQTPTPSVSALAGQGPVSLNFQDIDVRALLQILADFAQLNLVATDAVKGTVSVRLQAVSWQEALDLVLQIKGLAVRRSGTVMWVATTEEMQARDRMGLDAQRRQAELETLQSRAFQLRYTRAEDIGRSLLGQANSGSLSGLGSAGNGLGGAVSAAGMGGSARWLSPRGGLIFEPRTNQLFVTDVAARLDDIQRLIERVDVPVRQVLIEARIVEADDSFGRSLGVKLGLNGAPGVTEVSGTSSTTSGKLLAIDLPAQTGFLGGASAATSALALFGSAAHRLLNVELSALEAEGRGRIVAHPRLITTDQRKALIEQGEELPYQAATSSGATNIQFRKANLKLEVLPMITPEGHVMLEVDVNKDSVGRSTIAGFAIDTKHIRTEVLVENGGTVVIGGIYTQSEKDGTNQVPLLADMPLMGPLFQNRQRNFNKTELLVFLTPRVLTPPEVRRP